MSSLIPSEGEIPMTNLVTICFLIVGITVSGWANDHRLVSPTRFLPEGIRVPSGAAFGVDRTDASKDRMERRRIVEEYLRNGSVPAGYNITVRPSEPSVQLVELVIQTWVVSAWVNAWRYYYYYDLVGRLIEERHEQWNGTTWANYERYLFTYTIGVLIYQELLQQWTGSWEDASRYTYTYTKSGKKSIVTAETYNQGAWQNTSRDVYTYDVGDYLIELAFELWQGGAWTPFQRAQYTYASGLLTQILIQFYFGSSWGNYYLTLLTYNVNNLVAQMILQYWVVNAWVNSFRMSMIYGVSNELVEEVHDQWINNAWKQFWRRLLVYGLKALIVEELEQQWVENGRKPPVVISQDTGWVDQVKTTYSYATPTAVIEESTEPRIFSLGQNYPNPFNPETRIRLRLEEAARVTLTVFDMLGRTVARLIDGEALPAGESVVMWNAAGVPSGVYTYQLTSGTRREVRRMVLAR